MPHGAGAEADLQAGMLSPASAPGFLPAYALPFSSWGSRYPLFPTFTETFGIQPGHASLSSEEWKGNEEWGISATNFLWDWGKSLDSPLCLSSSFFFFFNFLTFVFERQRQTISGGGAESEGDTESEAGSRLRAVSTEPDAGLEPTNWEIMT